MPKLLWVLLPLAAAAAWLALRAWQGRMPARRDLNVLFSLLLLGYVGGTAGLGIFWVANQQLPVFDWHYLFGYTTVAVLLVHLGFNLRIVWQQLRRAWKATPPAPAAATPPAVPARRRPLLGLAGAAGLAAAAGLGYVIGLRHGRTELQLAAGASIDDTANIAAQAGAVVESFHAASAHSRSRVLRRAASSDWGTGPPPFKDYPGLQRLPLPPPAGSGAGAAADLAMLGSSLWHSAGISERRGGIAFRTSPSSGALFATELYVLALALADMAAGLWHYDPQGHALERLPTAPGALRGLGPLALPDGCQAVIVASAIFARSGHKYGDRTYRYVLADLGHALENLRLAVGAHGDRELRLLTHFDEEAIAAALGLEPRSEGVLAVAALGTARPSAPSTAADAGDAPQWTSALPPGASRGEHRLGLIEAMQWATSLRVLPSPRGPAPARVPPPGPAAPPLAPAAAGPAFVLPAARGQQRDVLRVIARRRSRRRFSDQPIPVQALADVLHAMTQTAPLLSPAVRIDVLTAAVTGLPAAAWRHAAAAGGTQPAHGGLQRRVLHGPDLRDRARAAALDQDVIGDAAVVFVLSLDRSALQADRFGPARGYRHGFIEAGLVGERIYLAAETLGLAACAVGAFYDDEAAALVGVDPAREWVVHFAALGVPA